MNNIAKILVGVGVVGVAATAAYVVTKRPKKERTVERVREDGVVEKKTIIEVGDSIMDRIKDAALKKAVRILSWAFLHKDQLTAAATLLGVVSAVFQIINAVKEYRLGKELHKKLNKIITFQEHFTHCWDETIDAYNHNWDGIFKKLNDIHLDIPHDGVA